jgi:hypothetical protein
MSRAQARDFLGTGAFNDFPTRTTSTELPHPSATRSLFDNVGVEESSFRLRHLLSRLWVFGLPIVHAGVCEGTGAFKLESAVFITIEWESKGSIPKRVATIEHSATVPFAASAILDAITILVVD